MKIFVSSEESIGVGNKTNSIYQVVDPVCQKLAENNYGSEFEIISIIPTIMEDRFLSSEWKERRLIRYAKKDADIRLIMDYNKFVNADEKMRFLLYVKVIVDSIKVVDSKKRGDFQGNELISDVLDALKVKWEDVKDLEELDPRYPLSRSAKENNDLAKQREMIQE
mgnify:CR=1 FL=1